jgi:hypothetical protein
MQDLGDACKMADSWVKECGVCMLGGCCGTGRCSFVLSLIAVPYQFKLTESHQSHLRMPTHCMWLSEWEHICHVLAEVGAYLPRVDGGGAQQKVSAEADWATLAFEIAGPDMIRSFASLADSRNGSLA